MRKRKFENEPIYLKAKEIFDTIRLIVDLFPEENEMLQEIKGQIIGDSSLILIKLASGISAKLYDIKMENAALIRKAARDLKVSYHSLAAYGFEDTDYYLLVRKQIEEFRLLFIDWVANFNPKHFITDNWGLFNPPGISHDYEQRSDELNFLDDDE